LQNEWTWSNEETLTIPIDENEEDEKFIFSVKIEDQNQRVILKLNSSKPVPPLGPEAFPLSSPMSGVEVDGVPFAKVTDGETERPVYKFWRKYGPSRNPGAYVKIGYGQVLKIRRRA